MKQKRNKKYRPKPEVLPLGMRNNLAFEMPGLQASVALGMEHFCEQHVYDLLSNADLVRRIAKDGDPILPVAQQMVEACAAIQERAQRTGRHGVTGDERRILQDGIRQTMGYLGKVPNTAIARAAADAVREFDRTGTLRV